MELLLLVCLCLLSCSGDDQVLRVRRQNDPGASEPCVTIIKTDKGSMLQCKVVGTASEPKVVWIDSSNKELQAEVKPTGNNYDVIVEAAVTKTDTFTCVVTEGSYSPLSAEIYAVNGAAAAPGFNTGLVTLWFLVLLWLF